MKILIQSLSILLCVALLSSCQKEESTLLSADQEMGALPDRAITILSQISINDGSHDNIVDGASCIELKLPITVNVNNNPVTISDNQDFETVELLIEEHTDDEDSIEIDFPIEIILTDHSIVIVNDLETLNQYVADCQNSEGEEDEDIESVDVRYPISFPIFNTISADTDRTQVYSDAELHSFISTISTTDIIGLDFPVTFILSDDTEVVINSYEVLENTIDVAESNYDDDDDLDFNDDDSVTLSEAEFINAITQCGYLIDRLTVNGDSLENDFEGYHFEFYIYEQTVTACLGTQLSVGTWQVTTINDNLRLQIDIPGMDTINRNWIVHEFEDASEISFDLRLGEDRLDFNMDCIDQTPDIIALLSTDLWSVYYFEHNDTDITGEFYYFEYNFITNGNVWATDVSTQDVFNGQWQVMNFGLELSLDFGSYSPLDKLNDNQWHIVYYTGTFIQLSSNTGNILVLEKN
tara:strand:- start:4739 stop:6136 length:1398 start_codon:yes stop_codon:yes gene_type:complete